MRLAVGEFSSNADDEHRAVFLANLVLPFLRCHVGEHLQEFFAVYEMDVLGEERLDLRVCLADEVFRPPDGVVNSPDDILEVFLCPLLLCDDRLPVPLVHIERVYVVEFLVRPDGVHVGIDAITGFDVVLSEREPLPFSERVHHFRTGIVEVLDGEGDGSLHSVEVVVDAESLQHEKGCCHAVEP